jgi:hypothetical protein
VIKVLEHIFAILAAKAFGGPEGAALKLAGPIYNYFKSRYYDKEISRDKGLVQTDLKTLDDSLMDLRQEIKNKNSGNWLDLWKQIGDLRKTVFILSEGVKTPDYNNYKTLRDKVGAKKKIDSSVRELADYIEPLQETVSEFRQKSGKVNNAELDSTNSYVVCLNSTYNKRLEVFDEAIKSFESDHPGTVIARKCKKKRSVLAITRKNASNEPEIDTYLGDVKTKLAHNPPEWNPTGLYLNDTSDWKVKSKGTKKVVGTQSQYFFHNLVVSCEYVSSQELGKLDLNKDAAKATRFTDKYVVKGIVTEEASQDLVKRVAGFSNPNLSVFLYETDKKQLTYNENNLATEVFSTYFQPGTQPVGMNGILKRFEINGIIPEADLKQSLRFSDNEVDKLDLLCVRSGQFAFYEVAIPAINARIIRGEE